MPEIKIEKSRFRNLIYAAALLLLLVNGCGVFVATPQSRVKREIRRLSAALSVENFERAAAFFDHNFVWIPHTGKTMKGSAAIKGYLGLLREIPAKRAFHIVPSNIKVVDEKNVVMQVKFRQEFSDGMVGVGNHLWDGNMRWVKRDRHWKILGIQDTTAKDMRR